MMEERVGDRFIDADWFRTVEGRQDYIAAGQSRDEDVMPLMACDILIIFDTANNSFDGKNNLIFRGNEVWI